MKLLSSSGSVEMPPSGGSIAVYTGFQPKIVFFMSQPDTANIVSEIANGHFSFGFSDGINQYCYRIGATNGAAFGHVHYGQILGTNSCVVCDPPHTATVDYSFALLSLDSTGFTINITNSPPINYRFGYLALGGATLQAKVDSFITSGGGDNITVGFQPAAVLLLSTQLAVLPSGGNIFLFSLGWQTKPVGMGESGCVQVKATYNSRPVVASRLHNNYWGIDLGAGILGGGINNFTPTGFTTAYWANPVGYRVGYAALAGEPDIFFKTGFGNFPTTTPAQFTGMGFNPRAGMFISTGTPSGASTNDATFNFGFAGSNNIMRYTNMFRDQAGVNTTNIAHASHDQLIARLTNNSGVVTEDIDRLWITDGFELVPIVGGPASYFQYLVAGDMDSDGIPYPPDPKFSSYQGFVV